MLYLAGLGNSLMIRTIDFGEGHTIGSRIKYLLLFKEKHSDSAFLSFSPMIIVWI